MRATKAILVLFAGVALLAAPLPANAASPPRPAAAAGESGAASTACSLQPGQSRKACITMHLAKPGDARVKAGHRITLTGVVRAPDASRTVVIQELKGGGRFGDPVKPAGHWKTIKKVSHNGQFTVKRKVSWGHHVYRAKVRLASHSSGLAAANTTATSATTTSTAGAWGYGYIFANDTGRNLQLTYTTGGSSAGSQSSSPVTFNDKVLLLSVLGDPPANLASAFTLKGEEAGIDETYKYDGSSGSDPCSKSPQPQMGEGEVAVILFENQTFGYKGTVTWPGGSTCSFSMLTSIEKFFDAQGPWAILLEVVAAVILVAVIVALTVVTGGGDLPELGDAAAAIAEGAEVGGDVGEAAADAAEAVAQELEDDLPNVTTFEGWPLNMGTMPSFPGGWQFVYPIPWVGGN